MNVKPMPRPGSAQKRRNRFWRPLPFIRPNFRSPRARVWAAYIVAVLTVALATVLRLALDPVLAEHHPFTLYFAAVAITAWYGGFGPGTAAIVLSYFAADWFFITPRFELNWPRENLDEFLALLLFLFSG